MKIDIKHGDKFCGNTVLKLLHSLSLSGKMIKHLKYRSDGILVNGEKVTVRYVLKDNDRISLAIEDDMPSKTATPSDIKIDIVYEDSEIVVADKPPFMPTHPSHGHHSDTLANAMAGYYASQNIPFVFRPINRLDRNTSGLVIVAKNKASAAQMTEKMSKKQIKKTYIAYLEGALEDPKQTVEYLGSTMGVIDLPLHRTEKSIIVREVCSPDAPDADESLTYYRILDRCNDCTKVEIFPQTGRTHQLRVHFAHLGHPILGDDLYGKESPLISRHALHAISLEFPLPMPIGASSSQTRTIKLSSPLPSDMEAIQKHFFGDKTKEGII